MYWVLIYVSLKGTYIELQTFDIAYTNPRARVRFLELLLHPFTPLYHGGKIYSYKSYLVSEDIVIHQAVLTCMYVYIRAMIIKFLPR